MTLLITDEAEFTWLFGKDFFLETAKGNYIWSDPRYGGDNIIRKFSGTYEDLPNFGRDKGTHIIMAYCPGARIVEIPTTVGSIGQGASLSTG